MQDPFPLGSICGQLWNNAEGQLSILKHAVSSSEEVFTFSHSTRQVVSWCFSPGGFFCSFCFYSANWSWYLQEIIDSIQGLKLQSQSSNHAWFCLDLLNVLCQLAENGYKAYVLSILEYPLKHCPEILLLGLAQIKVRSLIMVRLVFLLVLLSLWFLRITTGLIVEVVSLIVEVLSAC